MDRLEIPRTETDYYHGTRLAINLKMFFANSIPARNAH
jgi:hypothetical protein